ncbi:NAD(P)-dependent oxidoreductase [Arcicella sp. LKC2W]|uniref:NAD(P)-dependent oxidoreductase n=1 Tax=Arcicella sp. LKC2W TaxID=2984198 RepID=UPI002B216756|nr:NAD(P)-dependent oxidoreductase [Arcicella sp. LKC2W]MEA5459921.1 NAD(P)-dependent oxidoreductase [Arcicella sp. LKC2W]
MKKILIVDDLHENIFPLLADMNFDVNYQPNIKRPEILEIIKDYEGLIIRSKTKVDLDFLYHCDKLEFIARAGAGLDLIDLQEVERRKIKVFAANEGNSDAVAEHTLGMILGLFNKLNWADSEVRQSIWQREQNRGIELKGMTVGIIGFGNMGVAVAQRLMGFGVTVLAYDIAPKDWTEYGFLAKKATMEEIFEQADLLTIHVPLTPETKMMVNDAFIQKFKKNIFLINTSRGEVASVKAILNGLNSGKLRGSCLDVLENEKLATLSEEQNEVYSQLFQKKNVILSPHVAGWTVESYRKINEVLVSKIREQVSNADFSLFAKRTD